jgi:phage I-like protein
MAFKFKTKKRPTAAQAFAGGFAQGVSSGIQQAAQLSLQDRLNKQKEFEDFTKGLPQLINLAGLEGDEYKAAQEAQFMIRRGDIKSRDAFTSFLDGKSPGLSNRLLGATEPTIIGSPYTGYAEVRRSAGKTEVTPILEAAPKTETEAQKELAITRQINQEKSIQSSAEKTIKMLEEKKEKFEFSKQMEGQVYAEPFTEEDQVVLDKARSEYNRSLDRMTKIDSSGVTLNSEDDFSKYIINQGQSQ